VNLRGKDCEVVKTWPDASGAGQKRWRTFGYHKTGHILSIC